MALASATVRIADHDVDDLSLTAQPLFTVKATIRIEGEDKPLPAGSLVLDSDLISGYITATPRADGGFDFENVAPGRYRLLLRGVAFGKYYVKRLRHGAMDSPSTEFVVSAAADTLEVTLSSRGAVVSGNITTDRNRDPARPQVVLLPHKSDPGLTPYDTHLGAIDQSGAFTFREPVRPGEYTLYAFCGVPEGVWTDSQFITEIETRGLRLKLEEGDVRTVQLPIIPASDTTPILTRLGMN
jgi:hypothetical protein